MSWIKAALCVGDFVYLWWTDCMDKICPTRPSGSAEMLDEANLFVLGRRCPQTDEFSPSFLTSLLFMLLTLAYVFHSCSVIQACAIDLCRCFVLIKRNWFAVYHPYHFLWRGEWLTPVLQSCQNSSEVDWPQIHVSQYFTLTWKGESLSFLCSVLVE